MLLWQLKNARNRHILLLKLFTCSFITHLVFIGILFCKLRTSISSHKFTIHSNMPHTHIAVVLAPTMPKTIETNTHITHTSTVKNTKGAQKQPVLQKKIEPKKATTQLTAAKQTPEKPKSAPAEKSKQAQTHTKKIVEPKKEVKKIPEPVKKEIAQTKQPVIEPQKAIEKQHVQEVNNINAQPVTTQTQENYVEVTYAQAQELYRQEALKKELTRHWKPPHGIPATCSCEITAHVGNNGTITDVVFNQSSGVLMYDVSARAAVLAMNVPRWTWGESFTVTLKP